MRFWKYLLGSMIRIAGVMVALGGIGSGALGYPLTLAIPAMIAGVVLYLVGRGVMIRYGPYSKT